jgi:hypothetical protein
MFEPEDIFSSVEPTKPEPLRPGGAVSPTVPGRPGAPAPVGAVPAPEEEPRAGGKRKTFYVVIVVFLLLLLGVGGWLTWDRFFKAVPKTTPSPEVTTPAEVPANTPASSPTPEVSPTQPSPPSIDSDLDGLTDEEEATLGTDPNKIDTDEDDLTDGEEVKVYGTDPLNPDTDGDGYLDGTEVKAGYDPKGPGKLFELPK